MCWRCFFGGLLESARECSENGDQQQKPWAIRRVFGGETGVNGCWKRLLYADVKRLEIANIRP